MRWALYEAAQAARRPGSPDRAYYDQAAERLGGNRACLALARKLLKRSFHVLRELGDQALATRLTNPAVGARAALLHTDAPRPAPRMLLPPPQGGRPPKTERPQRVTPREHPINHHVTDPEPRVADRDKPGRPHAPHPPRPPRPRPTASNDSHPRR